MDTQKPPGPKPTFVGALVNMDRSRKIVLVLVFDALLILACAYLSIVLRVSEIYPQGYFPQSARLVLYLVVAGTALSWFMDIPRISVRSFDASSIQKIAVLSGVLAISGFAINFTFAYPAPRSLAPIFGVVFLVAMVATRIGLQNLFRKVSGAKNPKQRVLIYGAGAAGIQLSNALLDSDSAMAFAFVDDNPALKNIRIGRLKVHPTSKIEHLLKLHEISQIVLAIPSASHGRKQEILKSLQKYDRQLLTLPRGLNFMGSESVADQLRPVTAVDLLGRPAHQFDLPEIAVAYADKRVLVTGAGGSIGSELCQQILLNNPAKLVLFELNEYALYDIDKKLNGQVLDSNCELVHVLGSITDAGLVRRLITDHEIDVIVHAAAYKHVPIIESNEITGAQNNIIGTKVLADASAELGVKNFILISSDKAVRPPNVMGASKRFAELVIQDVQTRCDSTIFSMVRFGNVLDSSGSVIPLFREQIKKGGPVTVTHANVTRFFMTIREAAQLVLLAGTFAEGGDVFVLDMGAPVKVVDLARNLIQKSGLTEKTKANPDGDIEIRFIGLRPGEKLFEELLIGENVIGTPHPKIMRARETHMTEFETAAALKRLRNAIDDADSKTVRQILVDVVDGFDNKPMGNVDTATGTL